jgi:ABC-type lipoprotein release transport system permease subunit
VNSIFKTLLKVLFSEKSSYKFATGVIIGLAFSISVILATIGIMDGFEHSLKKALKSSVGDLVFYSKHGFFNFDNEIKSELNILNIQNYSELIQTEGFLLKDEISKGVLIKGVTPSTFNKVTGMTLKFDQPGIYIGDELLNFLGAKINDEIVLALAGGNKHVGGMPTLHRFKIINTVSHGIYQKDMRIIYMNLSDLQDLLVVGEQVNVVSANIPTTNTLFSHAIAYSDLVEDYQQRLFDRLGTQFTIRPFWYEFLSLIKAVKAEKAMIGLILQLVVIISIFNVLAFIIYLNEKRSRELFLFKALGMSQSSLNNSWLAMITIIWFIACSISILLVQAFNFLLVNTSLLELPGDVYDQGSLSIVLDIGDYALVFLITYIWIFGMAAIGLYKIKKQSILKGLRKEFA